MGQSGISFHEFSRDLIISLLGNSLQKQQVASVEYLIGYLEELKVQSVLVEESYVDRHYLDDFVNYYARSFSAPSTQCGRLHFWDIPTPELEANLISIYQNAEQRHAITHDLNSHYLGFVVNRPLPGAQIGRTVLKTYPADGRRHYEAVRPYQVHIGGIKFVVHGLAYQQQDGGAAVCASTSLWSALQQVAKLAGHRTPTPISITLAAQSPFPASEGLSIDRMATALAKLDYIADVFLPADNRDLFRSLIVSALLSELPVVLGITRKVKNGTGGKTLGHAVTLTGFSEPNEARDIPIDETGKSTIKMRGASLDTLYVHDDNLGSHAHYEFFDSEDTDTEGNPKLMLRRGHSKGKITDWWVPDEWGVEWALVPKPSKLRMPVQSLFLSAAQVRPIFLQSFFSLPSGDIHPDAKNLHFATRFSTGVKYQSNLLNSKFNPVELQQFLYSTSFPRHIGVVEVHYNDTHLCDAILDVTEIERDPIEGSLVGFLAPNIPRSSIAGRNLSTFASRFKISILYEA